MIPATAPRPQASEADIQRVILARLSGMPGVLAVRINSGLAQSHGRWVRFNSAPGCADVLVCAGGRFIAIEVKSATGRQTPDQRAFQHRIEAAGGLYVLARNVDTAVDAVRTAVEASR